MGCTVVFILIQCAFTCYTCHSVSADTQDAAHEEEQLVRVEEWINSRHTGTVDLADVLSNFPDISVVIQTLSPCKNINLCLAIFFEFTLIIN